jgi:hypothetical protein
MQSFAKNFFCVPRHEKSAAENGKSAKLYFAGVVSSREKSPALPDVAQPTSMYRPFRVSPEKTTFARF